MSNVMILIRQVIIMFLLMMIGYYAYKRKFISDQGSKDIGKILLNIALPMIVLSNFCIENNPETTTQLIQSGILALICMAASIFVSILVFHKTDRIGEFSAAFSNAGFIGIPLVQATFGNSAVLYISILIVLVNFLQWTYGVFTITDDINAMKPKIVLSNPIFLAVILGLIIYTSGFQMPEIASSILSTVSAINTPLAMMLSGVYLAQSNLGLMLKDKRAYLVSFVRLLLIPLVLIVLFRLIPIGNETMKLVVLLAGAAPVGANVAIFAEQYEKDYVAGIEYVCVSTLLCILTLPLVIYIAGLFF